MRYETVGADRTHIKTEGATVLSNFHFPLVKELEPRSKMLLNNEQKPNTPGWPAYLYNI